MSDDLATDVIEHFHREGWAVVPDVLAPEEIAAARSQLTEAAAASEAQGMPVRLEALDPGGRNIRGFLRPQTNWWRSIPDDRQRELSAELRQLLALDFGNMAHGVYPSS